MKVLLGAMVMAAVALATPALQGGAPHDQFGGTHGGGVKADTSIAGIRIGGGVKADPILAKSGGYSVGGGKKHEAKRSPSCANTIGNG